MALTAPRPDDWRIQQAIVLQSADAAVIRLLKRAQRDINAQLREIRSRPAGIGRDVREAQLNLVRRNLSEQLGKTWRELGNLIEARRAEAVARSIDFQRQQDTFTLLSHGVPGGASVAENIARTEAAQSSRGIDNMMARVSGASYVPLSRRVYNSNVGINSQVDRMVNSALARGLSAQEFARELEPFVNPNTPGGMRYAALRLARTEINNAAHAQAISSVQDNPWVKRMQWHLSGSHTKPDICNVLATKGPNGDGTYPKEAVPLKPHPQCFCYATAVTEDDDDEAFLNGLVEGFIEENRTETNPTGAPVSPPPPPAPPTPAVAPTPIARPRAARARPATRTPPPRPGVAPTPVPAPPSVPQAVRDEIDRLDGFGFTLPQTRKAIMKKFGVSEEEAERMIREVMQGRTDTILGRHVLYATPRAPIPAGPRVTPPTAIPTPATTLRNRPLSQASGDLPSNITQGLRDRLRSINQTTEGRTRELVQNELEFQATILPAAASRLRQVIMLPSDHLSATSGRRVNGDYNFSTRVMRLAPQIFEDGFSRRSNTGWVSQCGHDHRDAQHVVAHEFGHHAHSVFLSSTQEAQQDFWDAFADQFGIERPDISEPGDLTGWVTRNHDLIRDEVSQYGTTNPYELLAEVWAEYSTNPNARPKIKAIGEIFKRTIIEGVQ